MPGVNGKCRKRPHTHVPVSCLGDAVALKAAHISAPARVYEYNAFLPSPPTNDAKMFCRVVTHLSRRLLCLYLLNRRRTCEPVTAIHGNIALSFTAKNRNVCKMPKAGRWCLGLILIKKTYVMMAVLAVIIFLP